MYDISKLLAENMEAVLHQATPHGETARISAKRWAEEKRLDPKVVQRVLKGQHATTIKILEQLGKAAGLEVWQLLYPKLDPSNPPIHVMSATERQLYSNLRRAAEAVLVNQDNRSDRPLSDERQAQ